nr:MAG TPA: hypothetical protein [Bacteriophage sp.]
MECISSVNLLKFNHLSSIIFQIKYKKMPVL